MEGVVRKFSGLVEQVTVVNRESTLKTSAAEAYVELPHAPREVVAQCRFPLDVARQRTHTVLNWNGEERPVRPDECHDVANDGATPVVGRAMRQRRQQCGERGLKARSICRAE
jgi:hypothetical protein